METRLPSSLMIIIAAINKEGPEILVLLVDRIRTTQINKRRLPPNMILKCLMSLCLFLITGLAINGQETIIDKSSFDAAVSQGRKSIRELPYRSKSIDETFDSDGKLISQWERSTESQPPDRERHVSMGVRDGKISKNESLRIGTQTYVRRDEGEWTRVPEPNRYTILSEPNITFESYKKLGTEKVFDTNTVKYEQIRKFKRTGADNRLFYETTTWRYWIDEKGRIVKEMSESEYSSPRRTTRTTTTYDYTAKIQIEAPINISK